MICRDRRLMLTPWARFADLIYPVNNSRTITNKHLPIAIERQARGHAEIAGEGDYLPVRRDPVNRSIKAARDEHALRTIEGDACRIHDVAGKLFHRVVA